MQNRKGIMLLLSGVLLVAAMSLLVLFGLSIRVRTEARGFLKDFAALKPGVSTLADAEKLRGKYRGVPWNVSPQPASCTLQECMLKFDFENRLLRHVPGLGHVSFIGGITAKNGIVTALELDYSYATSSTYQFLYVLDDVLDPATEGYVVRKAKVDLEGKPHVIEVRLGSRAKPEERSRAYSLDLSCLARLYGCSAPNAIFPAGL